MRLDHDLRKGVITATRAAKIVVGTKYGGAFVGWHEAVFGDDFEPNEVAENGLWLESIMTRRLQARHPEWRLLEPGTIRDGLDWRAASPDLVVFDERLNLIRTVQFKSRVTFKGWGKEHTDAIPADVLMQVLWEMDVAGVDVATAAVLVGPVFQEYEVKLEDHADYLETQRDYLEDFHRRYIATKTPPPKVMAQDWETIRRVFRDQTGEWRGPTDEEKALSHQYKELAEKRDQLHAEAEAIRGRLVVQSRGKDIRGVLRQTTKRGSVDWKKVVFDWLVEEGSQDELTLELGQVDTLGRRVGLTHGKTDREVNAHMKEAFDQYRRKTSVNWKVL